MKTANGPDTKKNEGKRVLYLAVGYGWMVGRLDRPGLVWTKMQKKYYIKRCYEKLNDEVRC